VVKLRRALGDAAEEPRYIETLPKLGYRFLSPVADRSMAASPEVVERDRLRAMASAVRAWEWQPASTEKILDHKREYRPARALRRALLGVTILVAAAAVILGLWLHGSASRPEIRSLAVLPFDSGPTTAGQSLAARTTQELVASLTRIRVLEVVTPAPSEPGLAGALAPLEVRRLGVDAVVEGSVESVGSHVRVSLRLLHAASSRQLWAARYEREEKDLTGLENEIARDLARELEARVTPSKY